MIELEKLQVILGQNGYKMTNARKQVYMALSAAAQPLSNSEIIKQVKDADKVSVYRTLALYESIGVAHRIWNGFKSKIELSEAFSPHHHHFTCSKCNTVMSFKSKDIEKVLANLQASLQVSISQHLFELSGTCNDCTTSKHSQ